MQDRHFDQPSFTNVTALIMVCFEAIQGNLIQY